MSKSKSDRQRAANAIARVRRDSTSVTGPRAPSAPLPRLEMLAGGEFVGWDACVDAKIRLSYLPVAQLPSKCRRAVQIAIDDTTARTLRRCRAVLFELSTSVVARIDVSQAAARCHEALAFNLAALGCPQASAEISAAAAQHVSFLLSQEYYGEAYLCLRAAIVWASDACQDLTHEPYNPEPNYARLSKCELNAERWHAFGYALRDAEAQLQAADDVLRGGAGMTAPQDGDLALDFLGDGVAYPTPEEVAETRARESAAAPERPEPTAVRTLVVVPSLGHLAKPTTYAQERRDSPRAEFDRIAGKALPLLGAPDPQAFVEGGSAAAPWLRPVFETLAQDLVGAPYAWLRPTVLVSSPGTGKTATVRAVARLLGLPLRLYSAAGASDGSFGGTSRQWGTGRASIPLQAILQEETATVAVGIDEIEKSSADRRNGSLGDVLLPFLERENAKSIFDLYIETGVNLSAVTYLATANSISGIPEALRDRLRILEVPSPGIEHLPVVAANLVSEIRAERGLDAAWLPDLDGEELDLVGKHWRGGSLRPLRRLVETVLAGRDRLAPRH
ncbi:AAA family ATPase [Methylorubrum salsuginis]|uniref:ATPase family associated with various cellular activities (AAA) n=1 Tax=Methylorubrum salsuginis TaxID=414703 RepID=A0A1I4MIZ7_9HYPH|nr:AAA family ATPase [Methylorubrum salsuginis]SFM03189.1 ATPase family associated with various cellular activities (AAA) [Methylorubrum salsuginis]